MSQVVSSKTLVLPGHGRTTTLVQNLNLTNAYFEAKSDFHACFFRKMMFFIEHPSKKFEIWKKPQKTSFASWRDHLSLLLRYVFDLNFFRKNHVPFFQFLHFDFLSCTSWFLKFSVRFFLRILATFDWSDYCQFQKWFKPIARQSTTSKTLLMHWRVGNTSKFGEASKENMVLLVAIWIIIVPPFRIQKEFQLLRAEEHEVSSNIFLSRPKVVLSTLKVWNLIAPWLNW